MDPRTAMEIRGKISQREQDMRIATQRATDAVTELQRATTLFANPMAINMNLVEAALADLREARRKYAESAKQRDELKALLPPEE